MPLARQAAAPATRKKKERRGIQSAEMATDMLLALVEAGQAATLRDLARTIKMPTSLAHQYLVSLTASGLAVRNAVTGLYNLGPGAIRIGAAAIARVDPLRLAAEAMLELVATTGLTALLTVVSNRGPTIIRWERSYVPFIETLAVRATLPLTGSASGRAILAHAGAHQEEALSAQRLADQGAIQGQLGRAVCPVSKTRF